jgi:hypothetical protein
MPPPNVARKCYRYKKANIYMYLNVILFVHNCEYIIKSLKLLTPNYTICYDI